VQPMITSTTKQMEVMRVGQEKKQKKEEKTLRGESKISIIGR